MPSLIRLVANSSDEAVRRSLYASPIYVTCPEGTENVALMSENEIDGFNQAYVETAIKLSRFFKAPINWAQILLDLNVEQRDFIPINPIEVNEKLDSSSLKAFGGVLALSNKDLTCDGFVAPTQRASIQKRLGGEESEWVYLPGGSEVQADGSNVVDQAKG